MTKANNKVTIEGLIKKKDKIEEKQQGTIEIYVPSLDGNIVAKKATRSQVVTATKIAEKGEGYEGENYIVYHCVIEPNLKDTTLLETYGVNKAKGYDVVEKIFDWQEISQIATKIIGVGGSDRLVEEVKN